jgi:hypothetical protein
MRISDIIKKGYIEKARGQSVIKTASDSLEYILGNYTYNLFKGSVYEDINGRQFEYYGIEFNDDGEKSQGTANIIFAKGRNIGVGEVTLTFKSEITKFVDYEKV